MINNDKILLVRLPRVDNIYKDFYGVGCFTESGFVFALLTPDFFKKSPLRCAKYPSNVEYKSHELEIIGDIEYLSNPDGA